MQMTDSDFTLNDWRRWLGGGGAIHYWWLQCEWVHRLHIISSVTQALY